MQKIILALMLCGLLAACSGSNSTLTYDATLDAVEDVEPIALLQQMENVVNRKLNAVDVTATVTVVPDGDNGVLTVSGINSNDAQTRAENVLAEEFSIEIKKEIQPPEDESGEITVYEERVWEPTGITGSDIRWVRVLSNPETGEPSIEILFTDEGRKKLTTLFENNQEEIIGIFVREDILVSELKINSSELKERVIIRGVPSAEIATVFAEDVNVGLHVTLDQR